MLITIHFISNDYNVNDALFKYNRKNKNNSKTDKKYEYLDEVTPVLGALPLQPVVGHCRPVVDRLIPRYNGTVG